MGFCETQAVYVKHTHLSTLTLTPSAAVTMPTAPHAATITTTTATTNHRLLVCQQYEGAAAAEQQQEAAAGEPLPDDPTERRQHLKMADAARRQADEELAYEEVPQPDEDADGL